MEAMDEWLRTTVEHVSVSKTKNTQRIALVLSGFPRRSETFALNDVLALDERGLLAGIFTTKPGDGHPPHPDYQRLRTSVQILSGDNAAEQSRDLVNCQLVSWARTGFAATRSGGIRLRRRARFVSWRWAAWSKRKVLPTSSRPWRNSPCLSGCASSAMDRNADV